MSLHDSPCHVADIDDCMCTGMGDLHIDLLGISKHGSLKASPLASSRCMSDSHSRNRSGDSSCTPGSLTYDAVASRRLFAEFEDSYSYNGGCKLNEHDREEMGTDTDTTTDMLYGFSYDIEDEMEIEMEIDAPIAVAVPLTVPLAVKFWALDTRHPELVSRAEDLIAALPDSDRLRVSKYRTDKDRHHSLASILLQRGLIRSTFAVEDKDYTILRTTENKPYLCLGPRNEEKANWNYNVSHHGNFACIASHSHSLVGVDIVEIKLRKSWTKGIPAYIRMFKDQFSSSEIDRMLVQKDPLTHFFINWSLKEAFIKAIGTGLYFDLVSIEFVIAYDDASNIALGGKAQVILASVLQPAWLFEFSNLDPTHIVSVATGPVKDAAKSFAHCIVPLPYTNGVDATAATFAKGPSSVEPVELEPHGVLTYLLHLPMTELMRLQGPGSEVLGGGD